MRRQQGFTVAPGLAFTLPPEPFFQECMDGQLFFGAALLVGITSDVQSSLNARDAMSTKPARPLPVRLSDQIDWLAKPEETMKLLAPAIFIGLISAQGFAAAKFQVGRFDLFSEPAHVSSDCNLGTGLILDRGRLLGDVAVFEDFVKGTCKVGVRPNTRFSKITFVRANCGSRIYEGGFVTAEGCAGHHHGSSHTSLQRYCSRSNHCDLPNL